MSPLSPDAHDHTTWYSLQFYPWPVAHCESHLPSGMGAPCRWGPGLVHLCVPPPPPPVLRAERMLLKDVSSSQVRDGRLIQMTPLLSDSPVPSGTWFWETEARGRLRLLSAETAACRWPAPGARKPAPPPLLQSLASAPPTRPSGKRAGGSLFSITALEPHP